MNELASQILSNSSVTDYLEMASQCLQLIPADFQFFVFVFTADFLISTVGALYFTPPGDPLIAPKVLHPSEMAFLRIYHGFACAVTSP